MRFETKEQIKEKQKLIDLEAEKIISDLKLMYRNCADKEDRKTLKSAIGKMEIFSILPVKRTTKTLRCPNCNVCLLRNIRKMPSYNHCRNCGQRLRFVDYD